jgi:hypothetical protein
MAYFRLFSNVISIKTSRVARKKYPQKWWRPLVMSWMTVKKCYHFTLHHALLHGVPQSLMHKLPTGAELCCSHCDEKIKV